MAIDDMNNDQSESQDSLSENLEDLDPTFVAGGKTPANKGAVLALGLVAAAGAGIYFMFLHNGPQSAGAATKEQADAASTIENFLHGNGGSAKLMEETLKDTEKVVQEFQSSSAKPQIPVESLSTNPFQAREAKPETKDEDAAARAREQMLAEKARIQHEAAALELQSILRGTRSACMINNAMYHAGEQVGNFTIDEIDARRVVVHQGSYKFELTMKR